MNAIALPSHRITLPFAIPRNPILYKSEIVLSASFRKVRPFWLFLCLFWDLQRRKTETENGKKEIRAVLSIHSFNSIQFNSQISYTGIEVISRVININQSLFSALHFSTKIIMASNNVFPFFLFFFSCPVINVLSCTYRLTTTPYYSPEGG